MFALREDYLERVYAGVIGKLIGVYLGRPFEHWSPEQIEERFGEIKYYVNDKVGEPLVVTDDDVAGTFTFVRALEEHRFSADITAEEIGKTWLNHVIENRSIFWWGGNGISTEHTAFLNLKRGIPAPKSGAIETNGVTIAEQIGAQIFIDGWAMVAPGNPALAAKLAEAAGSVSHDGEAVYAAKLLAAMEAEAFVSNNVDHLLDTGLEYIPPDSIIAGMVADIRQWAAQDQDWRVTRKRIEDNYGYHKYRGICHVMPNHGLIIMSLIYGGHSFKEALRIVNTCGWDTDCNGGNIGCLLALMHGMSAFEDAEEAGLDFRGPIADRALISSGDGGYSINSGTRIAYDLTNAGRQLAGALPLKPPKGGAQFHFSLPGGVQGFQLSQPGTHKPTARLFQGLRGGTSLTDPTSALAIEIETTSRAEVLTESFTPPSIVDMKTYDLMASPLVFSGQTVRATIISESNQRAIVGFHVKVYDSSGELVPHDGPSVPIECGQELELEWKIPEFDAQPIQKLGIVINGATGKFWLDKLWWKGAPDTTIRHPSTARNQFWGRAFVKGASVLLDSIPGQIYAAQDSGEGIVYTGTRDWTDYKVIASEFSPKLGNFTGVVFRAQALNRYYALIFKAPNEVQLVKARDDKRIVLAEAVMEWSFEDSYSVDVQVEGTILRAAVENGPSLTAEDAEYSGGGVGIATVGGVSVRQFKIVPIT